MIVALLLGLIGLLCFYVEFFVPGGILAITGLMVLTGSSVVFFLKVDSLGLGYAYVLFLLVAAIFVCYMALRHVRKSGKQNSFFLQKSQEGFSVEKLEENLVGKTGVVCTELKPSGHVRIEEKVYQATSQGPFLSQGSVVEVIEMKSSHVIVKIKEEKVS
ncbi:MAG: NfeD family protein [Chlamydiota bacterium]